MVDMRFDDDVALITGAGRGLGREYALAFAARGAAVVLNDIADDPGGSGLVDALAREINSAGGRAVAVIGSVADEQSAVQVAKAAQSAFGKVTILVNNAGVIDFAPLETLSSASWRRMMAVTLDGMFYLTRALWECFRAQRYGRIINTTSNAGFAGSGQLSHYAAAKMGAAGFTKALAQECGDLDITVNAVAPMAITRMNRDMFFSGLEAENRDWVEDIRSGKLPMGPPSAVAPAVLWLAHRTTHVNGEIFSVSSGKVSRVAIMVGDGYFLPGHSPEDLSENEHAIMSTVDNMEPRSTGDELALIPKLFGIS